MGLARRVERLVTGFAERGVTVPTTPPVTRRILTPAGWLRFFETHGVPAAKGTEIEGPFTTLLSIFKEALAASGGSPSPPEEFMPAEGGLFRYRTFLACHHPQLSGTFEMMMVGLSKLAVEQRQALYAQASSAQDHGPDVLLMETARPGGPQPPVPPRVQRVVEQMLRDPIDILR